MSQEEVAKYKLPPSRKFKSKTAHLFPGGFGVSSTRIDDKFCVEPNALSNQILPHTSSVIQHLKGSPSLSTFTIGFSGQEDEIPDDDIENYDDGADPFADVAGCYIHTKQFGKSVKKKSLRKRYGDNQTLSSSAVNLHHKNPITLKKNYPDLEKVYILDNAEYESNVVPQKWFKKSFTTLSFEDWFVQTQFNKDNACTMRHTKSTTTLLAKPSDLIVPDTNKSRKWPPKIPDIELPTRLPLNFVVLLYKYQSMVHAGETVSHSQEIHFGNNAPFTELTGIVCRHLADSNEERIVIKYFHPIFHVWREISNEIEWQTAILIILQQPLPWNPMHVSYATRKCRDDTLAEILDREKINLTRQSNRSPSPFRASPVGELEGNSGKIDKRKLELRLDSSKTQLASPRALTLSARTLSSEYIPPIPRRPLSHLTDTIDAEVSNVSPHPWTPMHSNSIATINNLQLNVDDNETGFEGFGTKSTLFKTSSRYDHVSSVIDTQPKQDKLLRSLSSSTLLNVKYNQPPAIDPNAPIANKQESLALALEQRLLKTRW